MTINVIFVHGTSTREPDYSKSLKKISDGFTEVRSDIKVLPCYWGATQGYPLLGGGKSIPGFVTRERSAVLSGNEEAGSAATLDAEAQMILLWGLLYDDPFAELVILAEQARRQDTLPLLQSPDGTVLATQLADLAARSRSPELEALLQQGSIDMTFDSALATVSADARLQAVLDSLPDGELDVYQAVVARAIVAQALREAAAQGSEPALYENAILREETVAALIVGLEQAAGVLGPEEILGRLKRMPAWVVNQLVGPARIPVTERALKFASDILRYQTPNGGATIRACILEQVQAASAPVVLLGHSLGGVACVDLLLERDLRDKVKLLVTVGSQAPLFYEIGALQHLRFPNTEGLRQLPYWLNIYDRFDFLAFITRELFGANRIEDCHVSTGQPVSTAHNAYWGAPDTFTAICEALDHVLG